MNDKIGFILKVIGASALVSIFIKFIGPKLLISATPTNALIAVLGVPLVVAIALIGRGFQRNDPSSTNY
ncbi:hypothetical protein IQ235_16215 [Oscillatoriales cyanobacterium LEGE 11467]|uniref:Uncharacterized protein n=2 Tax=Zarconia TaxID=2992130 RepID=A0A928ZA09_9CYAN|nr:hypothetical protein [Zarconia navalis LEGE 11467]